MKNHIVIFLLIITAFCADIAAINPNGGIDWQTNYEQAVSRAKESNKPIILFFTGSDWCSWCNKLDEEVFDKNEFAQLVGQKFVFVKLDFPLYKSESSDVNVQNKQLQKKFNIRSFPTIVMLDPQSLQQIGTTGYRSGGPRAFAAHLEKMANSFSTYKQKISNVQSNPHALSVMQMRKLYEKAKKFNAQNDMAYLVKIGLDSEAKSYFLAEKYRFLAEEGQIHSKEALMVKQQLQTLESRDSRQLEYEVALIEFEAFCEEMHREHYSPDLAVAPLVQYIEKYGQTDRQNMWRLEMIISQVYLDRDRIMDALKHAQASYKAAPAPIQTQIACAIKSLQNQLATLP